MKKIVITILVAALILFGASWALQGTAARKAQDILNNVRRVIAMELMCACQAIDLQDGGNKLGKGTKAAYDAVRRVCDMLEEDRPLYEDINRCESLLRHGELLEAVRAAYKA